MTPQLNFLAKHNATVPLWEWWRDATWCREAKREWLAKMERYKSKNPKYAIHRAEMIIKDRPTDWDENIPKRWAKEFLRS